MGLFLNVAWFLFIFTIICTFDFIFGCGGSGCGGRDVNFMCYGSNLMHCGSHEKLDILWQLLNVLWQWWKTWYFMAITGCTVAMMKNLACYGNNLMCYSHCNHESNVLCSFLPRGIFFQGYLNQGKKLNSSRKRHPTNCSFQPQFTKSSYLVIVSSYIWLICERLWFTCDTLSLHAFSVSQQPTPSVQTS